MYFEHTSTDIHLHTVSSLNFSSQYWSISASQASERLNSVKHEPLAMVTDLSMLCEKLERLVSELTG